LVSSVGIESSSMPLKDAVLKPKVPRWLKRAHLKTSSGWGMVGSGRITRNTCGSWKSYSCKIKHPNLDSKDKTRRVYHLQTGCYQSSCPICYSKWAFKRAREAFHRITSKVWEGKIFHLMISPPKDGKDYSFRDARELLKKLHKQTKIKIYGGFMIRHDFRGRDNSGWKEGLHFHIVYDGEFLKAWRKSEIPNFFEKYNWVVKDHGERRHIRGTIGYLLTHASYKKRKSAYSWFGSYSRNSYTAPDYVDNKISTCDICGETLYRVFHVDGFKRHNSRKRISYFDFEKWEDWELLGDVVERNK
jgi:hypothetical protein